MARKTGYWGCYGYNDSPEALGEPAGFWQFESYDALWQAFEIAQMLNKALDHLGASTDAHLLTGKDEDGFILFHLLVLSITPIYPRSHLLLQTCATYLCAETGVDIGFSLTHTTTEPSSPFPFDF